VNKNEIYQNLKVWSKQTFKIYFYQLGYINVCKFNKYFGSHEILFPILSWDVQLEFLSKYLISNRQSSS